MKFRKNAHSHTHVDCIVCHKTKKEKRILINLRQTFRVECTNHLSCYHVNSLHFLLKIMRIYNLIS